jgi:hypothetical protein
MAPAPTEESVTNTASRSPTKEWRRAGLPLARGDALARTEA